MPSNRLLVLFVAGAALAACKDSSAPTGVGVPTKIDVVSGANQTALANTAVASPITVVVKDGVGTVLADKPVTIAVISGGGTITNTTATTDASGQATLAGWTLGKGAAPQRVRFTADTAQLLVAATVQTAFMIDVRFWGNSAMTADQQALFTTAAQRIEGIITGDITDALAQNLAIDGPCGTSGVSPLNETIDDVVIFATIDSIDGPGKILAQSGPCYIRNDPGAPPFPAVGVMEFDKFDLAAITTGGNLQDVITHEMMHVLGFGVVWDVSPLNLLDSAGTANPRFTGVNAIAGCVAVGGTSTCAVSVPVEGTPAPAGTADSHWRESVFDAEIMTGYIDTSNPISKMTIGQFADLGYSVNNADFDPYGLASLRASASGPSSTALRPGWDRVLQPRWALDPHTGRTRQLPGGAK
jgi:hypothetical protein